MPRYFTANFRRRIAPFVLIGGALLMGKLAHQEVPRDQEVRLLLSGPQQSAHSIRLTYNDESETVVGLELRFPHGAPEQVVHRPSLRPGHYDLAIELGYGDGHVEHLRRTLPVPSEGAARIPLHDGT